MNKVKTIYDAQEHKALYDDVTTTKAALLTVLNTNLNMFAGYAYDIKLNKDQLVSFQFLGTRVTSGGTIEKPHTITLAEIESPDCIVLQREKERVIIRSANLLSTLQAYISAEQAYAAYTIADAMAALLITHIRERD